MASGGVLSEEETPGLPQYSFKEMKALCDEAHLWGKRFSPMQMEQNLLNLR